MDQISTTDSPDHHDVFEVTRETIDKSGLEARILTGAAGANVTFDGVVPN